MADLRDIETWVEEKFSDSPQLARIEKLIEELMEWKATGFADPIEAADVVILIINVTQGHGHSLTEALNKKMEINYARQWKRNPSGNYSHIKTNEDDQALSRM